METILKIGTTGRGSIPSEVRTKLNIEEGDSLVIDIIKIIKHPDKAHCVEAPA